jgi:enoyl-CoA hydratase
VVADELLAQRTGGVELLTINRPDARNSIDLATSLGIGAALDALADDDDVRVVVLTGSGDRAFCAGMDLKAFARGEDVTAAPGGFAGITQRFFPKPIVAAVNGAALAGGFEVMLSCDIVVAANHAIFGIPEVTRGLFAAAGGLIRLPKRIPRAVALELALTGDPIGAARAHALGLVNRVVAPEDVLPEALAIAERIAQNAPLAVRASKEILSKAAELPEEEGWRLSDAAKDAVFSSEDANEGAVAFAEKRPPAWKGR